METKTISSLVQLGDCARDVLNMCAQKDTAHVIGLSGDLGVGKTAFTKELARHLGIKEEITSPTFVIMKSYTIPTHSFLKTLVHIDAYRIESDDEMRVLKLEELLGDNTKIICIEWPEKIQGILPNNRRTLSFTINSDGTRGIQMSD